MRREIVRLPKSDDKGPSLARRQEARILDGVLEGQEHARARAEVALVHQHRAPLEEIAVALEREVEGGVEQRVGGRHEDHRAQDR
jgi:hypothetical protein